MSEKRINDGLPPFNKFHNTQFDQCAKILLFCVISELQFCPWFYWHIKVAKRHVVTLKLDGILRPSGGEDFAK